MLIVSEYYKTLHIKVHLHNYIVKNRHAWQIRADSTQQQHLFLPRDLPQHGQMSQSENLDLLGGGFTLRTNDETSFW